VNPGKTLQSHRKLFQQSKAITWPRTELFTIAIIAEHRRCTDNTITASAQLRNSIVLLATRWIPAIKVQHLTVASALRQPQPESWGGLFIRSLFCRPGSSVVSRVPVPLRSGVVATSAVDSAHTKATGCRWAQQRSLGMKPGSGGAPGFQTAKSPGLPGL